MTTLPETKTLQLDLSDQWLTVWLNTPENKNALSDQLADELRRVFEAICDDREIRGVTLRGRGGVFCAGGDLKAFKAGLTGNLTHEDAATMNRGAGELFSIIYAAPQVVVVLIEGAAIAGGLGLACCADIIVASSDAKFALTETQIGLAPAQIAPYIARRIGIPAARRIMLTGARFNGDEALRLGLVDYTGADGSALDKIEDDLKRAVKQCAPGANAATKDILLHVDTLDPEAMVSYAANCFAECIRGNEGREGITAFIEKRKPHWAQ